MWSISLHRPFGSLSTRRITLFVSALLMALLASFTVYTASVEAQAPAMATWSGENLEYKEEDWGSPITLTRSANPENDGNIPDLTGTDCQDNPHIYYSSPGSLSGQDTARLYVICLGSPFDGSDKTQPIPAMFLQYSAPLGTTDASAFGNPGRVSITIAPEGTDGSGNPTGADTGATTYCDSEHTHGIGWIVCPLTNWLAYGMDALYELLSTFLVVSPVSTNRDSVMYHMWDLMRNLANILFIIGFLIIIYSQATSIGISNYGIKRLLPRLIIAAVLVNVSYWVVAIGVDLSNVLGASIKGLLDQIQQSIPTDESAAQNGEWSWAAIAGITLSGGMAVAGATGLVIGVVASAGASIYFLLPTLMGAIVAALVAILVLAARQAIITILIIISPLAFVAYLLPSTEKYFDRWRSLFITMLLVFPAFSLVFGGAQLAGLAIIHSADPNSPNYYNLIILGMIVQVAPVIITPLLIKLSGSLIGRIAGIVNDPNRGIIDRTRNFAQNRHDMRKNQQMWERDKDGNLVHNNPLAWGARKMALRERNRQHKLKVYEGGLEAAYEQDKRSHILYAENATNEMIKSSGENQAKAEFEESKTSNADLLLLDVQTRTQADAAERQTRRVSNIYEDLKVKTDEAAVRDITGIRSPAQDVALRSIVSHAQRAQQLSFEMQSDAYHQDAAKRVGELNYASEIKNNPERARHAGGVDEYGVSRAIARATKVENQAFAEAVENEKATMSRTSADDLTRIMKDASASVERRSAAAGRLMQKGSAQDIIETFDWVTTTADPDAVTIQMQIADDIGARKPAAVGEGAMAELSRGNLRSDMNQMMAGRILAGKMTGAGMAQMPKEELEHMLRVASSTPAVRASTQFRELREDIRKFRTDPNLVGTQPALEKQTLMDDIARLT